MPLRPASESGNAGVRASNGVAGLIERENSGSDILVSKNGREFGQLVEKGLMGAGTSTTKFSTST
ncbi:MAG: hypothetical protein U5J63_16815 [Fodinibius sp.]|nr:hypothetical protein [Fodinibius sp.]